MPGAVELAQLEVRISQLTDAELVDMVQEHPGDYEAWALDIGRGELARRQLLPTDVARLRAENVADAVERAPPTFGEAILGHFALYVLLPLGLVAFPVYFVLARSLARDGNLKAAKFLRFLGSVAILVDGLVGLTFLLVHFWPTN